MGRKGWTTDEEYAWLLNRIPEYREAQRQRKLSEYFQRTYAAFFQEFPMSVDEPDNLAVDGSEGNVIVAPALSEEYLKKREVSRRLFMISHTC